MNYYYYYYLLFLISSLFFLGTKILLAWRISGSWLVWSNDAIYDGTFVSSKYYFYMFLFYIYFLIENSNPHYTIGDPFSE